MSEIEEEPEEPTVAAVGTKNEAPQKKGKRQALNSLPRGLSEDELSNSGAQKLLLDNLDRLEAELEEAKGFREKYHIEATTVAVYVERFKTHTAFEVLSVGMITIGAVVFGDAYGSIRSETPEVGALIVGGILVLMGVIAKVFKP